MTKSLNLPDNVAGREVLLLRILWNRKTVYAPPFGNGPSGLQLA